MFLLLVAVREAVVLAVVAARVVIHYFLQLLFNQEHIL
jgi:hypothetical protein